jgi:hypothetical protein
MKERVADCIKNIIRLNLLMSTKYTWWVNTNTNTKWQNERRYFKDADDGREADSMRSMNQKPCWEAGATLCRNKVPRRTRTSEPWAPGPWEASLCHVTVKKQEGSCCHQLVAPKLLGRHSADQTSEHQASRGISPAIPGINHHSSLGRLIHIHTHTHTYTQT